MDKETFQSMLEEFANLSEITTSCREFILDEARFNSLDMINRDLLIAQLKAMETYLSILSIRLGINGIPENMPQEMNLGEPEGFETIADAILAGE